MSNPSSIVIGGGVAGLAAAWTLVRAGRRVTLLEARPTLGGRARSFANHNHPGQLFDSCQHVAMGCCDQLLTLFRQTGLSHLLKRQTSLNFLTPDGKRSRFSASPLPAPAHLLWAFLGLHHISFRDKWAIATAMATLARKPIPENQSFGDWLHSAHQSSFAIANFWDLVIISALNMPCSDVSPRLARKVFLDGFLASRVSFDLILPAIPLEDLFHRQLGATLAAAGVDIRVNTTVRSIQFGPKSPCSVLCRDGTVIYGSEIVASVPWDRAGQLFTSAPLTETREVAERGSALKRASISAVHLWYDRRVLATPHAALVGATAQWLFRHPQASPEDPYLQAVVSGSDSLGLDSHSLARKVIADIQHCCPAARTARLMDVRVVRERGATFQVPPGIDAHRPEPGVLGTGLAVAGDWTDTGWPATMEGACRSGIAAAKGLLNFSRE